MRIASLREERTRRAGIATFVMREREYLVAIFAQQGILCAKTLRFRDEIRDPETVGLAQPVPAPRPWLSAFERAIDAFSASTLSSAELADTDTLKLQAIVDRKLKAGKDLPEVTNQEKKI